MKCTLHADSFGRFVLKAQAGEYDGLPVVSEIFIDIPPVKRNQFRSAVAASLPFIAKTNGALETADAFFPLSASLLGQLAPFDVICQNIRWEPADIPGGSGILVLSAGASLTPLRAQVFPEEPDVAEVRLSKSGDFHGQISGPRLCLSASNLWLVRELDGISAFLLGLVAVLLWSHPKSPKISTQPHSPDFASP
jgi:hypothetical protein